MWVGSFNRNGYGRYREGGRYVMAHRAAHELRAGKKVRKGLVVDHLCRNRACIEHTEAVSPKVNTLRGEGPTAANARRTHCEKHGCRLVRSACGPPGTKRQRRCPECAREHKRAYRERLREKWAVRDLFEVSEAAHKVTA
jgi:hypothetical protein